MDEPKLKASLKLFAAEMLKSRPSRPVTRKTTQGRNPTNCWHGAMYRDTLPGCAKKTARSSILCRRRKSRDFGAK